MNVTFTVTPQKAMFILILAILSCNFINVSIEGTKYTDKVNVHHRINKINQRVHRKYPPIPSIVGIGPEKTGTTSLAYMLSRNRDKIPELIKPINEPSGVDSELRVWLPCGNKNLEETLQNVVSKRNPHCSLEWYQHFWKIQSDDFRNMTRQDKQWKYYYYFEKSPAYWCYEHVAFLFSKLLVPQGTKFIVLLRDPIKRTYSYWSHQSELGNVRESWLQYIDECMNDVHMHKMITIMKNKQQNIMQIEENLLIEWKEYVYSKDRKYGYIESQNSQKNDQRMSATNLEKIRNRSFGNKRRLRSENEAADSNSYFGLAASCYVVPLLMWLKYVPIKQLTLIQSEVMFGQDYNEMINDLRCWYSNGYEHESIKECIESGNKNANISQVHLTKSAKGKISKKDAENLYNALFTYCNERLRELIKLKQFEGSTLHPIQWNLWYHA